MSGGVTKVRVGKTTFHVAYEDDQDFGAEVVGDCQWSFPPELAKLLVNVEHVYSDPENQRETRSTIGEEADYPTEEEREDWEDDDWEPLVTTIADLGIGCLCALADMAQDGVNIPTEGIEWSGDNVTWLHHDAFHAEADWTGSIVHDNAVYYGPVTGDTEERSLLQGAVRALEAGIDGDRVIESLIDAKPVFEERFGWESCALPQLMSRVNITLKETA